MKNENNLEDSKKSLFGLSRRGLAGLPYNARHKSLKQEPFVLNFLQFFYIHSLHPCTPLFSLQCAPLLPHCWAESIFTEMTANPNQHDWGAGSGKSLKCFKICDEYWSSIAEVFFFFFLGPKETRNSLHFSPLVSKKTSDIQAGGWDDSLQRRFYSIEGRWRFASFAYT